MQHPVIDVPQPGRVLAVGDLGVDREQHGPPVGIEHVECFQPARRVLGEQQMQHPPAALHCGVSASDGYHGAQVRQGLIDIGSEQAGNGQRHHRVGLVRAAWQ